MSRAASVRRTSCQSRLTGPPNKKLSQNGWTEGDSPISLRRLRKIGTVPGRVEIVSRPGCEGKASGPIAEELDRGGVALRRSTRPGR